MAATVTNLIMGAGDVYAGDFGATEPADTNTALNSAPSTPFVDCGGTTDGVNLETNLEYATLKVDQIVDNPGRRLTGREFNLTTNLAEPTLANLSLAMNKLGTTTVGTAPAVSTFVPTAAPRPGSVPTYAAIIIDGSAPQGFRRRVIGRKMLSVEGAKFAYSKDDQTVLAVSFAGHFVSDSIPPYKVQDGTA